MHTESPWKSTDRVRRACHVDHCPIGESPALKYTRKPPSLALTLRVNTDEHRTTRGEYRGGVSIVQPAAHFEIVRFLTPTIPTQVLSRKYGVSQSVPRGKTPYRCSCSILRLESRVEKSDRVTLLIIRHFCILVQILRFYF